MNPSVRSVSSYSLQDLFYVLSIFEMVFGFVYIICYFIPGVPAATPLCGGGETK